MNEDQSVNMMVFVSLHQNDRLMAGSMLILICKRRKPSPKQDMFVNRERNAVVSIILSKKYQITLLAFLSGFKTTNTMSEKISLVQISDFIKMMHMVYIIYARILTK